jgi:hypothetical protein
MSMGGRRGATAILGLAVASGGCGDAEVRPPVPLAVPGRAPTPRPPADETPSPPARGPDAWPRPAVGHATPTPPDAPAWPALGPGAPTPDVALPVVPTAWPRTAPPVAPGDGAPRRWLHGARPVALAFDDAANLLVVYDAEGGRRTQQGRGAFSRAAGVLSPGVLRVETASRVHLACAGDAAPAAWSLDAGETFTPAAFTCGQAGRRTAALVDGRVFALLSPDTLGIGRPGDPTLAPRSLPGPATAIAALPPAVLVFGDGAAWRSEDEGATFSAVVLPPDAPQVREALYLAKARVVAVGDAPAGLRAPGIMVSDDAGRRFSVPTGLPRHTEALGAVASHDAHLLAVPVDPGEALYSDDDGRTLRLPRGDAGWVGAVVAARGGFVALRASPALGFSLDVAGLGGVAPPALDAVPLRDVAFPHPRVGLGVDAAGRLVRSVDGGRMWTPVAGAPPTGLRSLARADDDYGLYLAGDDGVFFSPAPGAPALRLGADCRGARLTPLADGSVAAACTGGGWVRLHGPDALETLGAPPDAGPAAALLPAESGALVVLAAEGTSLHLGRAGQPWQTRGVPVPAGRRITALGTDGGALVAVLDDGRAWVLSRFDGAWQARSAAPGSDGVQSGLVLPGGALVLATAQGVVRVDRAGQTTPLAPTTDVEGLRATGDGALILLGRAATTVLTPR